MLKSITTNSEWIYVSYGHFTRQPSPGQRGSMPHYEKPNLQEILLQQSSTGAFPSNIDVVRNLGFGSVTALVQIIPPWLNDVSCKVEVWITAVCAFLANKLANEKEVWEMTVVYARAFIVDSVDAGSAIQLREAVEAVIGS
jgi:hypothetical protein